MCVFLTEDKNASHTLWIDGRSILFQDRSLKAGLQAFNVRETLEDVLRLCLEGGNGLCVGFECWEDELGDGHLGSWT